MTHFAWNGPDAPGKFVVWLDWASERYPTDRDMAVAGNACWDDLGRPGALALTLGRPPWRYPAGFGVVRVGFDLSWYVDPVTKQNPSGLTPHDMTRPVYDPFAVRGSFVDDRYHVTAADLGKDIAHEIRHQCGMSHADMAAPDAQARLLKGIAAASQAARHWWGF